MEEKITKELKRIETETKKIEKKLAKASTKAEEKAVLRTILIRLDGRYDAYMNVLKMIKEGVRI